MGDNTYGRVTSNANANNVEIFRYACDAHGRLTSRWSKAKADTRYLYHTVGNLTNVVYPVSTQIMLAYMLPT
jgi:YD repeat-containing protein